MHYIILYHIVLYQYVGPEPIYASAAQPADLPPRGCETNLILSYIIIVMLIVILVIVIVVVMMMIIVIIVTVIVTIIVIVTIVIIIRSSNNNAHSNNIRDDILGEFRCMFDPCRFPCLILGEGRLHDLILGVSTFDHEPSLQRDLLLPWSPLRQS